MSPSPGVLHHRFRHRGSTTARQAAARLAARLIGLRCAVATNRRARLRGALDVGSDATFGRLTLQRAVPTAAQQRQVCAGTRARANRLTSAVNGARQLRPHAGVCSRAKEPAAPPLRADEFGSRTVPIAFTLDGTSTACASACAFSGAVAAARRRRDVGALPSATGPNEVAAVGLACEFSLAKSERAACDVVEVGPVARLSRLSDPIAAAGARLHVEGAVGSAGELAGVEAQRVAALATQALPVAHLIGIELAVAARRGDSGRGGVVTGGHGRRAVCRSCFRGTLRSRGHRDLHDLPAPDDEERYASSDDRGAAMQATEHSPNRTRPHRPLSQESLHLRLG